MEVLRRVKSEVEPVGLTWMASVRSPIHGAGGNIEVLVKLGTGVNERAWLCLDHSLDDAVPIPQRLLAE